MELLSLILLMLCKKFTGETIWRKDNVKKVCFTGMTDTSQILVMSFLFLEMWIRLSFFQQPKIHIEARAHGRPLTTYKPKFEASVWLILLIVVNSLKGASGDPFVIHMLWKILVISTLCCVLKEFGSFDLYLLLCLGVW